MGKKTDDVLTAEELLVQAHGDAYVLAQGWSLGKWQEQEIAHFTKIAQEQYEANKKNKQITIRISEKDLISIKAKAIKLWIPYQTLIGSQLHQFANA